MDDAEFLAAIEAEPDNDEPRLIYADWLSERGDPRGEFIVLQCRAHQAQGWERESLTNQADNILRDHSETWLGALSGLADVRATAQPRHKVPMRMSWYRRSTSYIFFERGFPDRVRVSLAEVAELDPSVLDLAPAITLRPTETPRLESDLVRLAGDRGTFEPLGGLDLETARLSPEGVVALSEGPTLERLHTLNLSGSLIEGSMRSFAMSGRFPRLQELHLVGARLDSHGLEVLAQSELAPLRVLRLDYNAVEWGGMYQLVRAPWSTSLRILGVSRTGIGDMGLTEIAGASWGALESLDATACGATAEGVRALAQTETLRSLERLTLSDNEIGDAGAAELAESEVLRSGLDTLLLRQCAITDAGAQALAAAGWERLQWVDFGVVRLAPETVSAWNDAGFTLRGTAQFERDSVDG